MQIGIYTLLKKITTENYFYANWNIYITEKYFQINNNSSSSFWSIFLQLKNISTQIGIYTTEKYYYWKLFLCKLEYTQLKNITTENYFYANWNNIFYLLLQLKKISK